ncbi:hypothetical protein CesoFtcFv8_016949 [Champsocephalus esox]|uniref:Uncharacterized protein n=1 Tax=Champsocephalus esox TaxID=159716 RepID=A0AAN8BIP3_9TELE|nr:hypothetical protein CesoFtcFv8_016949 [Champsocephalus esox]
MINKRALYHWLISPRIIFSSINRKTPHSSSDIVISSQHQAPGGVSYSELVGPQTVETRGPGVRRKSRKQ